MLATEFIHNLSDKMTMTLKFNCFDTPLEKINISKIGHEYLIAVIDSIAPIKFYEYKTVNNAKNKIENIIKGYQCRTWKDLQIVKIEYS